MSLIALLSPVDGNTYKKGKKATKRTSHKRLRHVHPDPGPTATTTISTTKLPYRSSNGDGGGGVLILKLFFVRGKEYLNLYVLVI